MAALVEAEVPNDSNHDCGPDAEWAEPAKDREHRKAGDDNESDPQFLGPAPDGLAEQVIHRRSVATLDRDQQPPCEIEHKPDTAAQREQDPSNSHQQWIDPPVRRHAAAKTCELGIRRTTSDRPDRAHTLHPAQRATLELSGTTPNCSRLSARDGTSLVAATSKFFRLREKWGTTLLVVRNDACEG